VLRSRKARRGRWSSGAAMAALLRARERLLRLKRWGFIWPERRAPFATVPCLYVGLGFSALLASK
jgi:hypothetical protein